MVATLVSELNGCMSQVRLEAYRPNGGGSDLQMITNYFWNVQLSKALYPSLHAVEICLRNSVHIAATNHYGSPFWFDQPGVLLDDQLKRIREAREKIRDRRKLPDFSTITSDELVSTLMLGFWSSLFNRPFEVAPDHTPKRLAWHDAQSNPTDLFFDAFPNAPKAAQSRSKIMDRTYALVWLRNRVMHHEPIWKYDNLNQHHKNMIELIGWINPSMRAMIVLCDDFPAVLDGGRIGAEFRIRNHIGGF